MASHRELNADLNTMCLDNLKYFNMIRDENGKIISRPYYDKHVVVICHHPLTGKGPDKFVSMPWGLRESDMESITAYAWIDYEKLLWFEKERKAG